MSGNAILYLPHGGGPLPLLNEPSHAVLSEYLSAAAKQLVAPSVIIMISAHWESDPVRVSSAAAPDMLFDYYGFPAEAYHYQYPAPGHPQQAQSIADALTSAGIAAQTDSQRGFDHGTFVPLILMYPKAQVPVVQISLNSSLDSGLHIQIGQVLAQFIATGAVLIGSGLSFHNMRAFAGGEQGLAKSQQFDNWLESTLQSPVKDAELGLRTWQTAPHARFCHPREEHLLPLHVCFGAASSLDRPLKKVFSTQLMNAQVSAFSG